MSQDRVCAPEMVITPKSDILLFKKICLFFPGDPYHGPEVEMWSLGKSHNLNGWLEGSFTLIFNFIPV